MQVTKAGKRALVVGATGLTGGHLLRILLHDANYERVNIFVRRKMPVEHAKLQQTIVVFDNLQAYQSHFDVDEIFCCLGTTIKKAGSKENFRKVDYTYPVELAEIAKANGVQKYLVISSLGADADARNFYLQTKGALEEKLKGFDFEQLIIVRPSLLLGKRQEFRFLERLAMISMRVFGFLLVGSLKKYRAIEAEKVAWGMVYLAGHASGKVKVVESDELQHIYRAHNGG